MFNLINEREVIMAQVEIIKANLNKEKKENVNFKMKQVCAYCRVSTDSEEQLTSYSSQIKHYSSFIKSNPNWSFVGIYADEGISGTQVKNRTEFMRMIEDAFNGKIDIIIAKSISRFARNTLDTLKYCRELREHNVDVYFEKENLHTLDLDSEMFLTFYSAFAQGESESISQNVKLGLKAKMKRGEYVGYSECYGYNWNKQTKELEVNEEQANVVRMIFDWYISGIGSFTISNMLNEKEIKSHRGGVWRPSSVRCVLTNEKYVGDLLGQKSYVENPLTHKHIKNFGEKEKYYVKDHHEAIITREVWNKAQEIYQKRSKNMIPNGKTHNSKYSAKYPFSSKIECGICGCNYARRMNEKRKDGTRKVYWACYNRTSNVDNCKDSIFINEELLEEMFIQIYNSIIEKKHKTKDKLLNAIKETLTEKDNKNNLDKLLSEKNKLDKRLSNLIDMKLDDYDNKDAYVLKEKEINDELKKINEQIQECKIIETTNNNISNQLKTVERILEAPQTISEFNNDIFENLVEKIIIGEVDKNGNINSNVIRFVLKIGDYYTYEINEDKFVSFRPNNVEKFS
jgi:DNA invertase Pin-like site-specific DNA recombinase